MLVDIIRDDTDHMDLTVHGNGARITVPRNAEGRKIADYIDRYLDSAIQTMNKENTKEETHG